MAKTAFANMSRDSIFVANPITDLAIDGGKGVLCEEESGPLDTPDIHGNLSIPDRRRLKKPLGEQFIAQVRIHGVLVPIQITKIGEIAFVTAGKRRVRALRRICRELMEEGVAEADLPKIRCTNLRAANKQRLLEVVLVENSGRQDDDLEDRIEKCVMQIESGIDPDRVAANAGVQRGTLDGWLKFYDNATDLTKQAVREGRCNVYAAAELAKIENVEEQNTALQKFLETPTLHKSARAAKAIRRGKQGMKSASDKKSQTLLLDYMQKQEHPRASEKTMAFWEGAEEMLKLVIAKKGEKLDERLVKALAAAREA